MQVITSFQALLLTGIDLELQPFIFFYPLFKHHPRNTDFEKTPESEEQAVLLKRFYSPF